MKKGIIIAICALISFGASAGETDKLRYEVGIRTGVYLENEQAWIVEPTVSWHLNRLLAISAGLEFTSQYNQPIRSTMINGQNANLIERDRDIAWMNFKPSLIIKTPAINLTRDGDIKLWFQASPGVILACPFHNSVTYEVYSHQGDLGISVRDVKFRNEGLKVFYIDAGLSAKLQVERWVVGIGYELSNFDYYSCRRNITLASGVKFHVPKKQLSQSIFLSVGYKF